MTQIIDLGKLRFYFRGEWSNSTVYEQNDVVRYGGNSYVYINVASTSGNLPTNVTYWGLMVEGLNFLGDWSSATAYRIGDAVAYGAIVYIALQDGTNKEPDLFPAYWARFSDSVSFAGVYSAGTTYQPNDIVSYGGSTFIALQTTTGVAPVIGAVWNSFAAGVRYRGNWATATAYLPNDLVFNGVSTYITTQAFTSGASFSVDYAAGKWTYFATGAADILPPITGVAQYGKSLTINNSGVIEWINTTNGVNVLYVSKAGNDSNPGTSLALAKLTIQGAIAAVPASSKTAIFVRSGTYSELLLPMVVPQNCAIVGDSIRTTIIQPGTGFAADGITPNAESQMWNLSDGSLLTKMTFQGMTGWVPGTTAADITTSVPKGIFCAVNPASPVIVKSPYVIECSAFSTGGIGAYVNGNSHVNGNRSILFHEYTGIHDNGVGIWVDNNAKSECVGVFTYFCYFGYATTNGGQIRSISGNNSYGTYGSFSSGYSGAEAPVTGTLYGSLITLTGPYTGIINPGDTIANGSGATAIATNVQVGSIYVRNVVGTFAPGNVITATSGGTGVVSTIGGQQGYTLVLNNLSAAPKVGQSIQIAGDTSAYVLTAISGAWVNAGSVISVALAQQKPSASADGSAVTIRSFFSLLRITAHDFLNVGTGGITTTNYPGTPSQAPNPANRVIENLPGRIYYVSADEQGNFNVGQYFAVNQATGAATLNANSFNLSGLTSLRLGSIGAQLGAQIDEFSTDGTMSQNSPIKVPTQSAVVTYVASKISAGTNVIAGTSPINVALGQAMPATTYAGFSSTGTGAIVWTLGSGSSTNLTIGASTGILNQVTTFTAGAFTANIIATYANGVILTKSVPVNVSNQIPVFPGTSLPAAVVANSSFSSTVTQATCGSGATPVHTLTSGVLPSWCTLASNGTLSGTSPGVTASTTYTFQVTATNAGFTTVKNFSWTFIVALPQGQVSYTTAGTYSWVAPAGVTSVSVVAVGGGGSGGTSWSYAGGSGGGLGWKNSIAVTPGSSYTVVVGTGPSYSNGANLGGNSYFISAGTVCGYGGGNASFGVYSGGPNSNSTYGGGWQGDGGGAGGYAGNYQGGGGAGGYSGRGGNNYSSYQPSPTNNGGGAGGGYYSSTYGAGAGGGVGLNGNTGNTGDSINSGQYMYNPFQGYNNSYSYGSGGGGGSGGSNGGYGENPFSSPGNYGPPGGSYGGGGGAPGSSGWPGGAAGPGAVRIIWGASRAYPTYYADVTPVP
jgi:hypothetical protein